MRPPLSKSSRDVAQDVGELQGVAERHGVALRSRDRCSRRCGWKPAPRRRRLSRCSPDRSSQVWKRCGCRSIRQPSMMAASRSFGMCRRSRSATTCCCKVIGMSGKPWLRPVFQASRASRFPLGREARIVRQIVHRPAEGVENHHVVPPVLRQDAQRERQIRFRAAGDFRGVGHGRFSG